MKAHKKIYIALVMITFMASSVKAQETYLLKDLYIPQALDENPGTYTPYQFHLGLFCFSRLQAGVSLPVNLDSYYHITSSNWEKNTHGNNFIDLSFKEELLNFGFRFAKQNYLWFNATINFNTKINIRGGFFDFLLNGNADSEGKTQQFIDKSLFEGNTYAEFAIGYNREINPNLSFGFKAKYLVGIAHAHSQNAYLGLTTHDDYDKLSLDYNLLARYGGLSTDKIEDFLKSDSLNLDAVKDIFGSYSKGAALDLGFRYRISKIFEIDASVLDLGFIHWKNAKEIKIDDTHIEFDGVHVPLNDDEDFGKIFENMADSMKNSVEDSEFINVPDFNKMLTTKINVGGYIWASKNDRFGLNFNAKIYNGKFIPSGSVSYHRNCGKNFDFTIGNTFKEKSLLNPGIGFSLKLGAFNLYALMDYFNSFYVDKLKNVNVAIGINFVSGRPLHIRRKHKEYFPSYEKK